MTLEVFALGQDGNIPPRAGADFKLRIELNRPVQASDGNVRVLVEKQRILVNAGGFPELRPTGSHYFDVDPKPIGIQTGERVGVSEPMRIKHTPQGLSGDRPVRLPESLLFSGYLGQLKAGLRACVVLIMPPEGS